MKKAVINIKVDEKEKKRAQKLAAELGFSLSSVMNAYLKNFLREERVSVGLQEKGLTQEAQQALAESEADYKAGRYVEFDNREEQEAWLDSIVADAEKRENNR